MKNLILTYPIVLLIISCTSQPNFEYFGQTPPGDSAILFAPGIISIENRNESMITFSPDGTECYFTEHHESWNWCKINETVYQDTGWSAIKKASFSNDYTMSPSVAFDGNRLFITANRDSGMDVFQCTRAVDGQWSTPEKTHKEISSSHYEFSSHLSSLGNMFVCSWREGGIGGCDGWRIPFKDGEFQKAENLGALNSIVGDCVWAPGPNEEFLVFQSRRPPVGNKGGFFETDLHITFAMPNGEWSEPQNLGPKINSDSTDGFAWVSHDGKYLFFSSDRRGSFDIFWVSLESAIKNMPRKPMVANNQESREFKIYQRYANLSDKSTTIHFDLDKPGVTKLTIYDRAGKKLNTILNEYRSEGVNQFVWEGNGYSKGEYLCQMQVSEKEAAEPFLESTIQVLLK